jgi:hypothetical protein
LGVAFKNIKVGPNMAYFPAITMKKGERVIFNFGKSPFKMSYLLGFNAIQEPDCFINNYYNSSIYLLEAVKRFAYAFFEFP